MVMSISEQITALEAELDNTKGPGSKDKKKAIQAKIDSLREDNSETEEEKPEVEVKRKVSVPVSGIPEYRKVTLEEVHEAEKNGKLCGFDSEAMTASIKD